MPVNVRIDGDVAVLSNFGRLMNDPRHFDASQDVAELLDQGYRKFTLELRGVNEVGASSLGLLLTITRQIRGRGGEVVIAAPSRGIQRMLGEMQLEDYWDVFDGLEAAKKSFEKA